ncbi:uncharacterized protein V6R79_020741 [Siganus canaliculatus]
MTGVCWMLMILVGCRLSHANPSQSDCAHSDQVEYVCVPAGHRVAVPCPVLQGEEVKFNLFKSGNMTSLDGELHKNEDNKSVSFMVTAVNSSSSAVYRCVGTVMYPPPLRTVPGDRGYLVLTEGNQCHHKQDQTKEPNSVRHWIWILAVVSVYSFTITVVAAVLSVKLRSTDSQSDYMNTKPRAHRERRRKGEVKHPIPRHF